MRNYFFSLNTTCAVGLRLGLHIQKEGCQWLPFLQIFAILRDGNSLVLGDQPIEGNMPMYM